MGVIAVIPADDPESLGNGELGGIIENVGMIDNTDPIIMGMATCHSLTLIKGRLIG